MFLTNCCDCGISISPPKVKRCSPCSEIKEAAWEKNWRIKASKSRGRCSRCRKRHSGAGICPSCRAYVSSWKSLNPAAVSLMQKKRRGGLRDTRGKILKILLAKQKGKCALCGEKSDKWHRDHIIPRKLGGCSELFNLQALCPTCNMSKGSKILDPKASERQIRLVP